MSTLVSRNSNGRAVLLTHQPASCSHCVCVLVLILLVPGEHILTLLLKLSVSPPEPAFLPENFKKKDVVEILSHKKAYNACEYQKDMAEGHTRLKRSRLKTVKLQSNNTQD